MGTHPMDQFLERYPPSEDAKAVRGESQAGDEERNGRTSPKRLPVEDTIDLHGLSADAATAALDEFVAGALRDGKRKVLIVHGKGNHDGSVGVLRETVRRYLERHRDIGATGVAPAHLGGTGATWAIVRQRSR